jgi:hypothetical protein
MFGLPIGRQTNSYLHRNRSMKESANYVHETLTWLSLHGFLNWSPAELTRWSLKRATEIDAASWSPKRAMTNDEYEGYMRAATRKTCQVICSGYGLTDQAHSTSEPQQPVPIESLPPSIQRHIVQTPARSMQYVPAPAPPLPACFITIYPVPPGLPMGNPSVTGAADPPGRQGLFTPSPNPFSIRSLLAR